MAARTPRPFPRAPPVLTRAAASGAGPGARRAVPARRSSACPRCRRSPRGSRRRPSAAAPAAAAPPPPVTAAPFCIRHRATSAARGGSGSAQRRSAARSIASAYGPAGRYGTGIHRALPGRSNPRPLRRKRRLLLSLLLLLPLCAARLGLGGRRPVPVRSRGVAAAAAARPERRSPRTHVGDTATCSRAAPRAPAHWLPGGPRRAAIGQESPPPRRRAAPLVSAARQSRSAGPAPLCHSRCERGRPLPPRAAALKGAAPRARTRAPEPSLP